MKTVILILAIYLIIALIFGVIIYLITPEYDGHKLNSVVAGLLWLPIIIIGLVR